MLEILSVCVYCGASNDVDNVYKKAAESLGQLLAEHGKCLVYGGGHVGLMGIIADAALEAGGDVVGIIPEHIQDQEEKHSRLTELHVVKTMHERKQMMAEKSDAFVILPGGLGTLDETFEILTWKYLGLHSKPIVLLNIDDYWTPLVDMVNHMVKSGFSKKHHRDLFQVIEHVDDLFPTLARIEDVSVPNHFEKA